MGRTHVGMRNVGHAQCIAKSFLAKNAGFFVARVRERSASGRRGARKRGFGRGVERGRRAARRRESTRSRARLSMPRGRQFAQVEVTRELCEHRRAGRSASETPQCSKPACVDSRPAGAMPALLADADRGGRREAAAGRMRRKCAGSRCVRRSGDRRAPRRRRRRSIPTRCPRRAKKRVASGGPRGTGTIRSAHKERHPWTASISNRR